jgi:hypothetical protein
MTVAVPPGLDAELVLAAIGLTNVLAGTPKFGMTERARALAIPRQIKAALDDFMASDKPGAGAPFPDFDWEAFTALVESDAHAREEALFAVVPGDLGIEVMNNAVRIQQLLVPMIQRTIHRSSVAVEVLPPSESEEAAIARTWSVAADPMIVFADLKDWSLSEDMTGAMREFYPAIYAMTEAAVDEAIDARRADDEDWDLSFEQDQVLRTLTGVEEDRPMLTADYEQLYADSAQQQAQAAAPRRSSTSGEDAPLATPGQKL